MSPLQTDETLNWLTYANFVELQITRRIHFKNASFLFDIETSLVYLKLLLKNNLKISIKNTICNANIYIQPHDSLTSPGLYFPNKSLGMALKDSFWTIDDVDYAKPDSKRDKINTEPKYSVLVYQINRASVNHNYILGWINAVLGYPEYVMKTEKVTIWEITIYGSYLHTLCPYCNACNPFQMISVKVQFLI